MLEIKTSSISENQFFHELVEMNKSLRKQTIQYEKSQEEDEKLHETVRQLTEKLNRANSTIVDLSEQVKLIASKRFGKSSEKSR